MGLSVDGGHVFTGGIFGVFLNIAGVGIEIRGWLERRFLFKAVILRFLNLFFPEQSLLNQALPFLKLTFILVDSLDVNVFRKWDLLHSPLLRFFDPARLMTKRCIKCRIDFVLISLNALRKYLPSHPNLPENRLAALHQLWVCYLLNVLGVPRWWYLFNFQLCRLL